MIAKDDLQRFVENHAQGLIEAHLHQQKHCAEIDLIKLITDTSHAAIRENKLTPICFHKDPVLGLFQKHFIVRHCLYKLAHELNKQGMQKLELGLIEIALRPITAAERQQQKTVTKASSFHSLSDYYLDVDNFFSASPESVGELLARFFNKYSASNEKETALETLGLRQDATWQTIQQAYRQQVAQAHPDKGGDKETFTRLREAYEVLRQVNK